MKLLENPHVLSWDELLKHADKARMLACKQFIYHYNQHKYRSGDPFKWGDETEGHIVKFNHETKTVRLCLRASSVLKKLKEKHSLVGMWTDECTESMLECCPQEPFGDVLNCFHLIEENMSKRKKEVLASLECDETYINMGMFPRLGTKQFTEPAYKPTPNFGLCKSLFIPDGFICVENEAYRALAILNDTRKGKRAVVNIPIFKDEHTLDPFIEDLQALGDDGQSEEVAKLNHVYEDCSMFGLSSCSLQITVQAPSLENVKFLHDQLCVLSPILMALSANAPVRRGFLTELDCRWQALAEGFDDRTRKEINHPEALDYKIPNSSRWESNYLYFSPSGSELNDIQIVYDEQYYEKLISEGIDSQLALQVSCALLRTPMILCKEQLEEDETGLSNILTLFREPAVNIKIPDSSISAFWRLECKVMDAQLTDFENSALAIFVALFSKVVINKKLNWLIPISKLQENFRTAQKRDAVREQKFWVKKDISFFAESDSDKSSITFLTLNEILNGSTNGYHGIIPVIKDYISENVNPDAAVGLDRYLKLIEQRASGETMTGAKWIREFILNHENYKHDSVVTEEITYDLLITIDQIQKGILQCPKLLGRKKLSKYDMDNFSTEKNFSFC